MEQIVTIQERESAQVNSLKKELEVFVALSEKVEIDANKAKQVADELDARIKELEIEKANLEMELESKVKAMQQL